MGAGRSTLVRSLLIESLVLGLAGGAAGLVLAYWATSGIASLDPSVGVPLLNQTRLDNVVIAFALGDRRAGIGGLRDHARLAGERRSATSSRAFAKKAAARPAIRSVNGCAAC